MDPKIAAFYGAFVDATIGCAHAMATYRSLLDPAISPDPECLPDEIDRAMLTLRPESVKTP